MENFCFFTDARILNPNIFDDDESAREKNYHKNHDGNIGIASYLYDCNKDSKLTLLNFDFSLALYQQTQWKIVQYFA